MYILLKLLTKNTEKNEIRTLIKNSNYEKKKFTVFNLNPNWNTDVFLSKRR